MAPVAPASNRPPSPTGHISFGTTSLPCDTARAPQRHVHRAHVYDAVTQQAWAATQHGGERPLFARRWVDFDAAGIAALDTLGYTSERWESCLRGALADLPGPTCTLWRDLSGAQRDAAACLGIDPHTWDRLVASRRDIFAHPRLLQAFSAMARAGDLVDANTVLTMLPAIRRFGMVTRSGQRALAYLRDFFPASFTQGALQTLSAQVNSSTTLNWNNHGWNASVVPKRMASEVRRARNDGTYMVNDASGMAAAAVLDMVTPEDVHDLRSELLRARHFGWPVNVVGTRHSQGGQSCVGGALHIDMRNFDAIALQPDNTMWVGAGATWEQVIRKLRDTGSGRTVQIMQASSIFSVGGSVSVNCHGRTANDGPIASTVEELRVLLADGTETTCSRTRNPQLFRHVVGGYGMAGVILAARLKTVEDEDLRMRHQIVAMADFPDALADAFTDENTLAFARLHPGFGGDAIVTRARPHDNTDRPRRSGVDFERLRWSKLEAVIFTVSKWAKWMLNLRWKLEKALKSGESFGKTSDMLDLNADGLMQLPWREGRRTDFLEELFIPFDALAHGDDVATRNARVLAFVEGLRRVQRQNGMHSLNITVRYVRRDTDTALPYAQQDSIAFVLYYNQRIKPGAARTRARLQRDLVALAQHHGGSFYLPYLRDYTPRQLVTSYPNLEAALRFKDRVDPAGLFSRVILPAPR